MIKKIFALTFIFLLLSACTSKDWYESLQADGTSCQKLPTAQQKACNAKVDKQMTYDEYSKERKKL